MKLRGQSLLEKRDANYIQFSEFVGNYSIANKNWRLEVDLSDNTEMLYDIVSDPQEDKNVIDEHKDIYKFLSCFSTIIKKF